MSQPLRIIFAGTPDFAARHLQALIDSEHDVVAVYTQPDRPAGRGHKLQPSEVKQLAVANNLPVFQPENFKVAGAVEQLAELAADVMVVVAYGLLLPKIVLETPKLGCINVHGSILPKWRGAAPIQRALWAGDQETGVTIMQMDVGLDTGAMLHIERCPITEHDTSASLYDKLAAIGPQALIATLENIADGSALATEQDNALASYAKKLSKEEAQIDWALSAEQLQRNVRAFNPWPMASIRIGDDNVKVWQAQVIANSHDFAPGRVIKADKQGIDVACGEQVLRLLQLQPPGKKAMAAHELLNFRSDWFVVGQQVGQP